MKLFNNNNLIVTFIDSLELILIGAACFCYSIFYRSFAELHIQLTFLGLYIFAGEILLGICLFLLIVKWIILKRDFDRPAHYLLSLFLVFILINAFWGYYHYGILAYRDSAMFYYFFFSVITYDAYEKRYFLNKKLLSGILIILIILLWSNYLNNYFLFTYLALIIILLIKSPTKFLKILCILAFTAWLIFRGKDFFYCPRGILVARILGIFVILFSVPSLIKIKKRYAIFISIVCILIFYLLTLNLGNKAKIFSLINFQSIISRYIETNKFIKENEKSFVMNKINPRLYSPDCEENPRDPKILKERQDKLKNDIFPESNNKSPSKKETLENNKPTRNLEIDPHQIVKENDTQSTTEMAYLKSLENKNKVPKEISKNSQKIKIINATNSPNLNLRLSADKISVEDVETAYSTSVFRLIIWRDMLKELWDNKAILGMGFGKPLRSKSVEITRMGYEAWSRDGWIFPHNSYLHILYRSGIVGLSLLVMFFIIIGRMLKKSITDRSIVGIILISIIIYWLTVGFTLVLFELPYHAIPFWSLFGITFAYLYKHNL